MVSAAEARGIEAVGAARHEATVTVDVTRGSDLRALLDELSPDLLVNCAAVVDLAVCEADPATARAVNALPAATLAAWAQRSGTRWAQVSTDHFWTGDGAAKHDEDHPIVLLNEYARSKRECEELALADPGALVIRTNIVGFRGWPGRPTFAEWALDAIEAGDPLTLFDDFHTSSIEASACAEAVLDLLGLGATGLLNVASSEVASKRQFVEALAAASGVDLDEVSGGSVRGLEPRRAESLGLDVRRAEALLGHCLPDLEETVAALVARRPDV